MEYGVKIIHTIAVGEKEQRYYEELILKVEADSFDHAYEKAERYVQDLHWDHINPWGESVKTLCFEAVDCFLIYEPEGDVQEAYSSFSRNTSALTEEEYYEVLAASCGKEELRPLRHAEFNRSLIAEFN